MFASKSIAEDAQWHKLKRKEVDNELSHPADGEAWKDFDRKYKWFAKDARNIRLGLATRELHFRFSFQMVSIHLGK
jgi:hypothetical protein